MFLGKKSYSFFQMRVITSMFKIIYTVTNLGLKKTKFCLPDPTPSKTMHSQQKAVSQTNKQTKTTTICHFTAVLERGNM